MENNNLVGYFLKPMQDAALAKRNAEKTMQPDVDTKLHTTQEEISNQIVDRLPNQE